MVSVEKTTTTASVAPHGPSWADGFMDILAKYERNSERQLYVYGISASRCPICRHRVKTDGTACEKCGQTVSKKSEKCTRCAKSRPELWCYECDKYFCEVCHKKPHTLMLGGEPQLQHNCYPIDGSSGKLFRHGSWSSNLLAMTKDARKQQVKRANDLTSKGPRIPNEESNGSERDPSLTRKKQETAKSTQPASREQPDVEAIPAPQRDRRAAQPSVPQQRQAAEKRRAPSSSPERPQPIQKEKTPVEQSKRPRDPRQRGTERPASSPPHTSSGGVAAPPKAPTPVLQRSPSPAPTPQPHTTVQARSSSPLTRSPSPSMTTPIPSPTIVAHDRSPDSQQSRKRKSPGADSSPTVASSTEPAPQSIQPPQQLDSHPSAPASGLPPVHASTNSQRPSPPGADGRSLYVQMRAKHGMHSSSASPQSVKSEPASVAPSGPSVQSAPAPSIQPAAPFFGAAVSSGASSHSVQHEPVQQSTAPATAVDYGIYNSLFERVELPPAPVVDLTATSPSGSTAIEDPLTVAVIEEYDRCNEYTLKIEAKITSLNAAVRKASLQDVNMAAKINEHIIGYRQTLERAIEMRYRALAKVVLFSPDVRTQARSFEQQQLGDVPHVLTACHNKSAQIAIALHQMQKHLVDLRHRIDRAIASGDPTLLMQLQTLGNQITETEQQIRQAKKDRDSQFVLMVQFSRRLRETVQREANESVKPPH